MTMMNIRFLSRELVLYNWYAVLNADLVYKTAMLRSYKLINLLFQKRGFK